MHGIDKDTVDVTNPRPRSGEFFDGIGQVDILVNNAGGVVGQVGHPLEESPTRTGTPSSTRT